MAAAESRKKAQRVRDVTTQAHAEGRHTGKAPLGYRWTYPGLRRVEKGTLVVHEPIAAKIRRLFAIAVRGTMGLADLRREAIKLGLLSPHSSPTTIRLLLSHPIYVGGYRRQGPKATCIDMPDGVNPPIVDRGTWQRVQELYFAAAPCRVRGPAANTNGKAPVHVLAGLFRCGEFSLQRNAARQQYRWRASTIDEYHGHREDDLLELLVEQVLGPVSIPPQALDVFTKRLREHLDGAVPSVEQAQAQLEVLRRKAMRIIETIADPELCTTPTERAGLVAKRAKILADIEALEKLRDSAARAVPVEKDIDRAIDYIVGLGAGWKSEDPPTQREILLTLLDFKDGPPIDIDETGKLRSIRYAPGWRDLQAIVAEALADHERRRDPKAWKKDPVTRRFVAELDRELHETGKKAPASRVTAGSGRGSGAGGSSSGARSRASDRGHVGTGTARRARRRAHRGARRTRTAVAAASSP